MGRLWMLLGGPWEVLGGPGVPLGSWRCAQDPHGTSLDVTWGPLDVSKWSLAGPWASQNGLWQVLEIIENQLVFILFLTMGAPRRSLEDPPRGGRGPKTRPRDLELPSEDLTTPSRARPVCIYGS